MARISARRIERIRTALLILPLALVCCLCAAGAAGRISLERAAEQELVLLRARVENDRTEIVYVTLASQPEQTAAFVPEAPQSPARSVPFETYEALRQENEDFVGWLCVPDTQADVPVMLSRTRPRYYYQRDFEGNESRRGLPFIDESSGPDAPNMLIYGHNMKNGSIFGELKRYLDESFYQAHRAIYFDTPERAGEYRIVAVCLTQIGAEDEFRFYDYAGVAAGETLLAYAEKAFACSEYAADEPIGENDRLMTLVTCSNHVKDGRLIVVAKRVS